MGSRGTRTKKRLGRLERDILEELSFGDLAYGFFLSARSSRRMMKLARERATERYRRKRVIERLRKSGFLTGDENLSITTAGLAAIGVAASRNRAQQGKVNWDHKWHIVAYDIPVPLSNLRDMVRRALIKAGFVQLQQSLWIFPYQCDELVQLIRSESKLTRHIFYGVLEQIEDEDRLKKQFDLR